MTPDVSKGYFHIIFKHDSTPIKQISDKGRDQYTHLKQVPDRSKEPIFLFDKMRIPFLEILNSALTDGISEHMQENPSENEG